MEQQYRPQWDTDETRDKWRGSPQSRSHQTVSIHFQRELGVIVKHLSLPAIGSNAVAPQITTVSSNTIKLSCLPYLNREMRVRDCLIYYVIRTSGALSSEYKPSVSFFSPAHAPINWRGSSEIHLERNEWWYVILIWPNFLLPSYLPYLLMPIVFVVFFLYILLPLRALTQRMPSPAREFSLRQFFSFLCPAR